MPYNTGLKGPEWSGRERLGGGIEYAESERGMVFAHDVCDPLSDAFIGKIAGRAECLYCEIPWPRGSEVFYRRAGIDPKPHGEYIDAVGALIGRLGKPAFIVGSKRDGLRLAGEVHPIILNGGQTWLAVIGTEWPKDYLTTEMLLTYLAGAYVSVYDFGCGYGNALKPFSYFVGSDMDRKCVAYIAAELL